MKKEDKDKKKDVLVVEDMYMTLSQAKRELQSRRKDKALRKKVKEYLGEIPKPFRKIPRAAISRSVITPNQELLYFLDLAKHADLKPIGLEGVEDKFCTKNYDKVSLGKLTFFNCENFKNRLEYDECKKSVVNIIDLQESDGKRFCDIETLWGERLADFHHRLLDMQKKNFEIFDDFAWFKQQNKKSNPNQYYSYFFALFLSNGILFENFHAKGKEKDFTEQVILKNFEKVYKKFGIKPLIVPLVPIEDELSLVYWHGYMID